MKIDVCYCSSLTFRSILTTAIRSFCSVISINDGETSRGRAEIEEVAKSFYSEFPDVVVRMDDIRTAGNHAVFRWTLEGTNTGPGGSGHRVKISGWEAWRLTDELLLAESDGRFDAEEYARQLAEGV